MEKKKKNRKRDMLVNFYLSHEEYLRLKRTARQAGFTVAGFLRKLAFSDSKIVVVDSGAVRELYKAINAVGNNINQIARVANSQKYIQKDVIDQLMLQMGYIQSDIDHKLRGL